MKSRAHHIKKITDIEPRTQCTRKNSDVSFNTLPRQRAESKCHRTYPSTGQVKRVGGALIRGKMIVSGTNLYHGYTQPRPSYLNSTAPLIALKPPSFSHIPPYPAKLTKDHALLYPFIL